MAVKFQVERRPISSTGKVYRGTGVGDYILTLTHPDLLVSLLDGTYTGTNAPKPDKEGFYALSSTESSTRFVPATSKLIPALSTGAQIPALSHVQEINGEPWLVHSTHYSIESAIESAAPLAGAVGRENVRIVKVLSHTTVFKLN